MSINKTKPTTDLPASAPHINFDGGTSYDLTNPLHKLKIAASSSFFGEPMYYSGQTKKGVPSSVNYSDPLTQSARHYVAEVLGARSPSDWSKLSPSEIMEKTIDEALNFDAETTLKMAASLRNEDFIRTTPQVILVRAAMNKNTKGTNLIRKYAKEIIKRADEPSICIAYFLNIYGKKTPIPNSLKRALADALAGFSEYEIAKYRMEAREVKTIDVVNLVHPKSTTALDKLVRGELKTTGQTWESIRSAGGSWDDAIKVMGHMALLRNLRNFAENKVNPDLYLAKLVQTAKNGKQLPFRYYSAFKALEEAGAINPRVMDAIESCLTTSIDNLPQFSGRVAALADYSGSAQRSTTSSMGTMKIATIAGLTSVIIGMLADEGHVGVFGNKLEMLPIRKKSSVFDQLKKVEELGQNIGLDTENGVWLFLKKAIQEKQHWDSIFIQSDIQIGHGKAYGLNPNYPEYKDYRWIGDNRFIDVPKLITQYRKEVNPNVQVFLIQVAGYTDTIIPEFFDRTYCVGGWSAGVLQFAAKMMGAKSNTDLSEEDGEVDAEV